MTTFSPEVPKGSGVPASPSGSQATPEARKPSSPSVSIPNAVHNVALCALDDIMQGNLLLTDDQRAAISFARYAILRERDKFAPEPKFWGDGDFLLYRRIAHGREALSRYVGGGKLPNFRHKSRAKAEAEAARLLTKFPESTFIILREIGRVKLKPAASAMSAGTAETPQAAQGEARQRGPEGETPNA